MKHIFLFLIAACLALGMPLAAIAAEADTTDKTKAVSNVNLTVVIPKATEKPKETPPPEPKPVIPKVYPVGVYESNENGTRQIIKTYELGENEKPTDIPRDGFDRDGWHYEVSDIIKKETSAANVREHTKTVTLDTETKDIDTIIKMLAPTVEFTADDGYTGILTLDIKSISVETAGTKKNTFTVSAVREYQRLSNNDISLVPKTISDNGRTLKLSTVKWRTSASSAVDYEQLPDSYTAVATYTTTGSRTVVTGYTTTAEYKGSISKLLTGKTVYTAIFYGEEIMPELLPMIEPSQEATKPEEVLPTENVTTTTTTAATPTEVTTTEPLPTETPKAQSHNSSKEKAEPKHESNIPYAVLAFISGMAVLGGCLYFFMQYKKRTAKKEEKEVLSEEKNDEGE